VGVGKKFRLENNYTGKKSGYKIYTEIEGKIDRKNMRIRKYGNKDSTINLYHKIN